MNKKLKKILAKVAAGEELTKAEQKYLEENSDQLSAKQRKDLGLKSEDDSDDDAGDDADDSDDDGDDDDAEADADADSDDDEDEDDEEEETDEVEADEGVKKFIKKEIAKGVRSGLRGIEKTVSKDLGKAPKTGAKSEIDKLSPAVRTIRHFRAYLNKDFAALKQFNEWSLEKIAGMDDEIKQRAGYANEGTAADGGNLVPPADFVAEVARLEPQYGVARSNGIRVRTLTKGNATTVNKKTGFGIQLYETGEGAAKTGVKMQWGQDTVTLKKYAGIAPVTDELDDDSAVDVFQELTTDFARAKAYKEDQLVFTDSSTGLVHQAGLAKAINVGSAIAGNLTYGHLVDAKYAVPTQVLNSPNAKWFVHRGAMAVVEKMVDSQNRPIYLPDLTGKTPGTLLGFPIVLTEVLSGAGQVGQGTFADGNNTGFILFGDLGISSILIDKGGLALTVLTEGTVHGSDGSAINLAEQDMKALRGVARAAHKPQFPGAFSLIGTGGVS